MRDHNRSSLMAPKRKANSAASAATESAGTKKVKPAASGGGGAGGAGGSERFMAGIKIAFDFGAGGGTTAFQFRGQNNPAKYKTDTLSSRLSAVGATVQKSVGSTTQYIVTDRFPMNLTEYQTALADTKRSVPVSSGSVKAAGVGCSEDGDGQSKSSENPETGDTGTEPCGEEKKSKSKSKWKSKPPSAAAAAVAGSGGSGGGGGGGPHLERLSAAFNSPSVNLIAVARVEWIGACLEAGRLIAKDEAPIWFVAATEFRALSSDTRTTACGLSFPVDLVARDLRRFGHPTVEPGAAVYLSAVLEYLTAEIIELSGNAARRDRNTHIQPMHLHEAVEADNELSSLIHKMNEFTEPNRFGYYQPPDAVPSTITNASERAVSAAYPVCMYGRNMAEAREFADAGSGQLLVGGGAKGEWSAPGEAVPTYATLNDMSRHAQENWQLLQFHLHVACAIGDLAGAESTIKQITDSKNVQNVRTGICSALFLLQAVAVAVAPFVWFTHSCTGTGTDSAVCCR